MFVSREDSSVVLRGSKDIVEVDDPKTEMSVGIGYVTVSAEEIR